MDGYVFLAAAAVTFPFLEPLNARLLEAGVFAVPDFVPISLNPLSTLDSLEAYRLDIGGKAIGNWWPAITLFVVNLISVTSEELWWRGIVLPRQEKGLGAWAWIIHGVLWAPFHLFKYWAFIPLFGVTLGLAYLGQRTKNTTPVFILHFLINVATGVAGAFLIAMGVGIS